VSLNARADRGEAQESRIGVQAFQRMRRGAGDAQNAGATMILRLDIEQSRSRLMTRIANRVSLRGLASVAACVLMTAWVASCGQGVDPVMDDGTSGANSNDNTSNDPPAGGAGDVVMRGSVCFEASMEIPEEERAAAIEGRETLEGLGITVADDGSSVSFEANPGGWRVVLGDESAFVDFENNFSITVVDGGATEGTIFDPPGEVPWAFFTVDQLVGEDEETTPIEIPFEIRGGCCMDADDPCCATADDLLAKLIPSPGASPALEIALRPQTYRTLAAQTFTYPTGNETTCLDYDGPVLTGSNASEGNAINYLGSTCYLNVVNGCCANENGTIAFLVLDRADFERYFGNFENCANNHKGRFCQEITKGDVGWIPSGEIPVKLGETELFALHNNGCFGVTYITLDLERFGGEFSGDKFDGLFVQHYETGGPAGALGGFAYQADQMLEYKAPKCVDSMQDVRDTYTARVDGYASSLTFELDVTNLWQFQDGTTIFSAVRGGADGFWIGDPEEPSESNDFKGCDDFHVHGAHPCSGAADPDDKGCGHGKVTQVGG